MKEHPIPQDITGYRFHIVGNMTLKQFGELLAATLICFGIFSTNLPAIIMWPLIIIVAILGVVAAFVPIEERPLSHWLVTFYGILYKPTQFFWKRAFNIPEPFLYKGREEDLIQVKEVDLTPIRRQRIKEFISSSTAEKLDDDFTLEERNYMQHVLGMFSTTGELQRPTGQVELEKPDLKVRVRTIRQISVATEELVPEETITSAPQMEIAHIVPQEPPPIPEPLIVTNHIVEQDEKTIHLETKEVAQNIDIPVVQQVRVEGQREQAESEEIDRGLVSDSSTRSYIAQEDKPADNAPPAQQPATTAAQFNPDLPFPDKPTVPNKLVGMVLTANKELVPSAIVEIQTQTGQVVRAVKTNALGQFFVATPLKNGVYRISVEKTGFQFSPLSIELKGKIVDPLEITGD